MKIRFKSVLPENHTYLKYQKAFVKSMIDYYKEINESVELKKTEKLLRSL